MVDWRAVLQKNREKAGVTTKPESPSVQNIPVTVRNQGSEWVRIANLESTDYFDTEKYPDLTDSLMRKGQPRVWRNSRKQVIRGLNASQNALCHAMKDVGGAVGAIAVGGGKAAGGMLCGAVYEPDLLVFVTTPTTLHQVNQTYADWRIPFKFDFQFQAITSSWLQQKKNARALGMVFAKYKKPMLVLDEAHLFANPTSARTGRLARLIEARPDIAVVVMSGTLMSKSLKQMTHLCEWALKGRSPVPVEGSELLEKWANVIDVDGKPGALDYMACSDLVAWATNMPPTSYGSSEERRREIRSAFAHRFHSARGVVATTKSALGTDLTIYPAPGLGDKEHPLVLPPEVRECLKQIEMFGEIRTGDLIEILPDKMAQYRASRLLSMGFFQRWDWPLGKDGVPKIDHDWMEARSDWFRCVRNELKNFVREGYDSELCVREQIAHEYQNPAVPKREIHAAYVKWAVQCQKRWKGQPHPPTVPVWISTFYVDWIVNWVKSQTGRGKGPMLVWYESQAIRDALAERGFEVLNAGQVTDWSKPRNLAVSILSHSTGIDMPAWHRNLILEPPSGAVRWEQTIGRTHREGQIADEVEVYVPQHATSFVKSWKSALRAADVLKTATRNDQKLCYATIADGLDKIFDADAENYEAADDWNEVLDFDLDS